MRTLAGEVLSEMSLDSGDAAVAGPVTVALGDRLNA